MEIALTKMSSKGQIVIPSELREDIKEGEKLIIIKNNHQLILKKAGELGKQLKEDIEFARRTEEAWRRHDKGLFKSMKFDNFLKEIEYDPNFRKILEKSDPVLKEKVKKQIKKIVANPEIGKPMMYARKGTRELYIRPFRPSYAYIQEENKIIFLNLYHKGEQ